jgi:hypothetical protein
MNAQLQQKISPEFKERLQRKAHFNFNKTGEYLFRRPAELTTAGPECCEKGRFGLPGIEVVPAAKA